MKKSGRMIISLVSLLFSMLIPCATGEVFALDAPHNTINTITCTNKCHVRRGPSSWWTYTLTNDNTTLNKMCKSCHNASDTMPAEKKLVETHSRYTTSSTKGGNWSMECRVCHSAHNQQAGTFATTAGAGAVTGLVSSATNSCITVSSPVLSASTYTTYILVPNTNYPTYTYRIKSNTDTIICVENYAAQPINTVYSAPGSTYVIMYPNMVKTMVSTATPSNPGGGVRAVKFFRKSGNNSFADGDGTIDGICQVCHTQTHSYTGDGSKFADSVKHNDSSQAPGQNCTTAGCHSHKLGFKPEFTTDCAGCHGNPPSADQVGKPGLAGSPSATYPTNATGAGTPMAGGHVRHSGTEGQLGLSMGCTVCHEGAAYNNLKIEMGFSAGSGNYASWTGGAFSGGTFYGYTGLTPSFSWIAGNVNTTITPTSRTNNTCANLYCHGGGAPGVPALTGGIRTAPAWTGGVSHAACGTCHGASKASPPTMGSHPKHAGTASGQVGLACTECHGSFYSSPTATHVNGSVAWSLNTGTAVIGSLATYRSSSSGATGALAPSGSYGQCSVYCHLSTTPTWSVPLSANCTGCHGGGYASGNPMSTVVHDEHVSNVPGVGKNIGCAECHIATASTDTAISTASNHINYKLNIKFNSTSVNKDTDLPTYNGVSTTIATGATKTPGTGGYTCSNVYCHSIGNLSNTSGSGTMVTAGGASFRPIDWNGAAIVCDGCHGGGGNAYPTYATGTAGGITANSHGKHVVSSNLGCDFCHVTTTVSTGVSAATMTLVPGGAHLNRIEDVAFKTNGSLTGVYNSTRTCSSTYCHGTGPSVAWGGSADCASCHEASSKLSSGQAATNRHALHYAATATATGITTGNTSTAGGYVYNCGTCHDLAQITHAGGPAPSGYAAEVKFNVVLTGGSSTGVYTVGTTTYTDSRGYKYSANNRCSNVYCHSNGAPTGTTVVSYKTVTWDQAAAGPNCGVCHSKQGDASPNWSVPHTKHVNTYSANSNMTCNACHAQTASSNTVVSDRSKHVDGLKTVGPNSWVSSSASFTAGVGCANTYCHSNGAVASNPTHSTIPWTGSLGCNSCHGSDATTLPASAAHAKHAQTARTNGNVYLYSCKKCHAVTVSGTASSAVTPTIASYAVHVNKTKDVDLDAADGLVKHSSSTLTPSDNGSGTCSNVYCHSIGNPTVTSVGTGTGQSPYYPFASVAWTAGTLGCDACHGRNTAGYPDYVSSGTGTTASNTHIYHKNLNPQKTCDMCHADTAASNTILKQTIPSKHVNGSRNEVVFPPVISASAYDTATKSCYITGDGGLGCHTNSTYIWGGTGGCTGCHGNPPGPGSTGMLNTSSGRTTLFPANPAGAHLKHVSSQSYSCYVCHGPGMTSGGQANQKIEFGFDFYGIQTGAYSAPAMSSPYSIVSTTAYPGTAVSYPSGTQRRCSNIYCHSNGAGTSTPVAIWDQTNVGCDYCHITSNMPTSKHPKHVTTYVYDGGSKCVKCHSVTAASDTRINDATKHSNTQREVNFDAWVNTSGSATYPSAAAGCQNIYCHSNSVGSYVTVTWGATMNSECSSCHGGNASAVVTKMTTSAHSQHINSTNAVGRNIACGECHNATVAASDDRALTGTANHVNKLVNIRFDNAGNINKNSDNPLYNGTTTSLTTGATVAPGTWGSCANVYCHSIGNLSTTDPAANTLVSAGGASFRTLAWSTATIACDGCHGGGGNAYPTYATGTAGGITANSHGKHVVSSNLGCDFCHVTTTVSTGVSAATMTLVPGGAHLNRIEDVAFKTNGSLTGVYNNAKTCSSTYCHGTGPSVAWGGSADCASCHEASSKLSSGQAATNRHALHYAATATATGITTGNTSTTGGYVYNCGTCHDLAQITHAGGPAPTGYAAEVKFNVSWATVTGGNYSAGTATYTDSRGYKYSADNRCSNVYCHSNGAPTNTVATYASVSWNQTAASPTNCDICHKASPATNVHTKHISTSAGNYGYDCADCHYSTVSTNTTIKDKALHVNAVKDVAWDSGFNPVGSPYTGPNCSNLYCHSKGTSSASSMPVTAASWTGTMPPNCTGCHGGNSASTSTITTYAHGRHAGSMAYSCTLCHAATTISGSRTIDNIAKHVDKLVDVKFNSSVGSSATYSGLTGTVSKTPGSATGTCAATTCHGAGSPTWSATFAANIDPCVKCHGDSTATTGAPDYKKAPPADTASQQTATARGVGAHQVHLNTANFAYTVPLACANCHKVPALVTETGHIDDLLPADVTFTYSSLARTNSQTPSYNPSTGQCSNVYCHGVAMPKGSAAAPTSTPSFTDTNLLSGTPSMAPSGDCDKCHYSPPATPAHSSYNDSTPWSTCKGCHSHMNGTTGSFDEPWKHVDGVFQGGGVSNGGSNCNNGGCHTDFFPDDSSTAKYTMHSTAPGINYKHFMSNPSWTYYDGAPDGSQSDVKRRCTMCHVDHDLFNTPSKAANLRDTAIGTNPTATNTDFSSSQSQGGLCLSCHSNALTKAVTTPNNEPMVPAIPFAKTGPVTTTTQRDIVANSTHAYSVTSGSFGDNTAFKAVCVKCHNDTIGINGEYAKSIKGAQQSAPKFGEHQSTSNSSFAIMGLYSSGSFTLGMVSSSTTQTVFASNANWSTDQWKGFSLVLTGGTGENQRRTIARNNATSVFLTTALTGSLPDTTTTFDIVKSPISTDDLCFSCHSKPNQNKPSANTNKDWYGQKTMKASLEGMKDLFVGDDGPSSPGASNATTITLTTKNQWLTADQLKDYVFLFPGGKKTILTSSGVGNQTTLTWSGRTNVGAGAWRILKPATHPLDTYGRHSAYERVTATAGWNRGDTGSDTLIATDGSSVTSVTDNTKAWPSANQWQNMYISFPRTGVTVTITSSGTSTLGFASQSLNIGEQYYITPNKSGDGGRHVSCGDCHNTHASTHNPEGIVTTGGTTTLQAADAVVSQWTNTQWNGYFLRVRDFTGTTDNGREQIRQVVAFDKSTGMFTVSSPWDNVFFAIGADDHYEVMMGDKWTSSGQQGGMAGSGSTGIWGAKITGGWTAGFSRGNGTLVAPANLQYAKVENVFDLTGARGGTANTGQRDLCIRCHSYYSFGTRRPGTPSAGYHSGTGADLIFASTDVAAEFNPNNVAHHAVYARGNNQPVRANYGNTTLQSVHNPNWQVYSTGTDTVVVSSGTAVFSNPTVSLPRVALPGWFLYIGSDAAPTGSQGGGSTRGYLEIVSISTPTTFNVRRETGGAWPNPTYELTTNVTATANWFVTAGLGNTFVPPYGPWSILRCTDCHGSTKTDPVGPHASVNKWLIKDADTALQFSWMSAGGAAPTYATVNYGTDWVAEATGEKQTDYVCFNCHRADVYGTKAIAKAKLNPGNHSQSRLPHGQMWADDGGNIYTDKVNGSGGTTSMGWPQYCRHCHGGDKVGGIHGSNAARVQGDTGIPQSIRFLNGATWRNGLVRPTTAASGSCYTIVTDDSISYCNKHTSGTGMGAASRATYDYSGY